MAAGLAAFFKRHSLGVAQRDGHCEARTYPCCVNR